MSDKVDLKDAVLSELRLRKIKLWLSPYYNSNNSTIGSNTAVLEDLAGKFAACGMDANKDQILVSLIALQEHALERLVQKRNAQTTATAPLIPCLALKILGRQRACSDITVVPANSTPWLERVETTDKVLKLFDVDSSLTITKLCEYLVTLLEVDSVRLIYRGHSIQCQDHRPIYDILQQDQQDGKTNRQHHPDHEQKAIGMLCLAYHKTQGESPDRTLIASIRKAATKLGAAGTIFDITDQHGKHVPMLPSDRLAFLTALGLHRLGRRKMATNLPSALVFLMEADHEWDKVAPQWVDAVDNYGLLQLDIAWVYMKLESIDNLPDVVRRLDVAERTLRKQVHSNFVTLALVQAEMGNAVPPLATVFCRLFLLQGIAYRFSQEKEMSLERLDWAHDLCCSLRRVSASEHVHSLCNTLGVTPLQAISALRKTNGNPNEAASLMFTEKADAERQSLIREQQNELGLCENMLDYVDLNLIVPVGEMLGFVGIQLQQETENMDSDVLVVAGLLRLSNNNIEKAIDIFQKAQRLPHAVLELVSDLDKNLEKQGYSDRKRHKRRHERVDDIALATLMSMGVDESRAKRALQKSHNNVDQALMQLSTPTEENIATSNSNDSESGGSATVGDDDNDESQGTSTAEDKAKRMRDEGDEAEQLLKAELSDALQDRDLEQEYFGSTLDEEWAFIERFRVSLE